MLLSKDYKEMLQSLSDEGVKYLVVGAYALAVHGFPRATGRTQDIADVERLAPQTRIRSRDDDLTR